MPGEARADAVRVPRTEADAEDVILSVTNVRKRFPMEQGLIAAARERVRGLLAGRAGKASPDSPGLRAVDDVSFEVYRGETLGIVGESGCGKTTLGRLLVHLASPTSGSIRFRDRDVRALARAERKWLRRRVQFVFQDAASSLNPRRNVRKTVGEPLYINGEARGAALKARVQELLETVGLKRDHMHRFPHELSGGQKQRVGIARALALAPEFMVLDEPTSALDVSVQAQVLNLLRDLQARLGLTYVFITHALNVVQHVSDRVAVMYLGRIVEIAPTSRIFEDARHPYTRALLSAVPEPDPRSERMQHRVLLPGDVPSPSDPPSGCRFHSRCPVARDACKWDGHRFANRVRETAEPAGPLGDPDAKSWVPDRGGVTLTHVHPDRVPDVAAAVDDVLAAERVRHGRRFWRVHATPDGVRVDFEPTLRPVARDTAASGPSRHLAACFFAEDWADDDGGSA